MCCVCVCVCVRVHVVIVPKPPREKHVHTPTCSRFTGEKLFVQLNFFMKSFRLEEVIPMEWPPLWCPPVPSRDFRVLSGRLLHVASDAVVYFSREQKRSVYGRKRGEKEFPIRKVNNSWFFFRCARGRKLPEHLCKEGVGVIPPPPPSPLPQTWWGGTIRKNFYNPPHK